MKSTFEIFKILKIFGLKKSHILDYEIFKFSNPLTPDPPVSRGRGFSPYLPYYF